MSLKLYNTLTRTKQEFIPLESDNVRMYVCGPTVYDYAHIGNARPVIVFDVLFRLLRHIYGEDKVTYVRNITDVDDKINARAAQEGGTIQDLTKRTTKQFHEDIKGLGVLEPNIEPRATEHIEGMIEMTKTLIESGHAYEADGHVLFDVSSDKNYGGLSNRSVDEMMAGARVEVADYKKNPMDFVLWKPSSDKEPGWDSPWGTGRPGWHLECSVMSKKYLGETFDIHGGGLDLIFPHHENEIAQSTCAHENEVMANYWMHNGYLQVEGEKMSKSLGNFITINELLKEWPGEVVRLTMLMTHYRKPIDWTQKTLTAAQKTLDHWYELTSEVESGCILCADVLGALEDDLNTPKAITALHELRREAAKGEKGAAGCLKACAQFLGLLTHSAAEWRGMTSPSRVVDEAAVQNLINARIKARDDKDWGEADRIRDELVGMGIVLKDGKDPQTGGMVTSWEVAR